MNPRTIRFLLVRCILILAALVIGSCGKEETARPTVDSQETRTWEVTEWGAQNSEGVSSSPNPGNPISRREDAPRTIILMIADDQHYRDFGFGGNPAAVTPRIDELAREGALFPVAHVGMSRCRPSLACLLTGIYPHQNGVYYNFAKEKLDPSFDTLPRQLRTAGYACWAGGKYWEGDPRRMGFSHKGAGSHELVRQGQLDVAKFLEASVGDDVFLWWAPMLPHVPHDPDERLLGLIDEEKIEQPAYVSDEDWPEWRARKRIVLAMGAWLDEGVGEVLKILEENNRLENTLIVFLVDNGYEINAPAKGTAYERGFRTPVILWDPRRIAAGATLKPLISSLDLLPTILDWAGAETPSHFQGHSLWPLLEDPDHTLWRDRLFGAAYPRRASSPDHPIPEADVQALYVRTERWKYILYLRNIPFDEEEGHAYNATGGLTEDLRAGDEYLFDLDADREELTNLALNPIYESQLQEYRGQVFQWWNETGGGPLPLGPEDFAVSPAPSDGKSLDSSA